VLVDLGSVQLDALEGEQHMAITAVGPAVVFSVVHSEPTLIPPEPLTGDGSGLRH